MKKQTAWKLISDLLDWDEAELSSEMSAMQLLADLKYDRYQGFQPAAKFHIALINWLKQFSLVEQRRTAYDFLKERLIFISQKEMYHLVSLMMPAVERSMRRRISDELGIQFYQTWLNHEAEKKLKILLRKTLFVGLSDGARIDVFRRFNEGSVSNEQVVPYSEISGEKWEDLVKELRKSLDKKGFHNEPEKFDTVCLVDDFTGSGSSLIRYKNGEWKGKIKKFFEANHHRIGSELSSTCRIHVHHHLASDFAKNEISERIKNFAITHDKFGFDVTYSHVLPGNIVIDSDDTASDLCQLLIDHYDAKIEDEHVEDSVCFGYKGCGLPLVLDHNTPNNSVALLWAQSGDNVGVNHTMKPLFARRKRHSSDG